MDIMWILHLVCCATLPDLFKNLEQSKTAKNLKLIKIVLTALAEIVPDLQRF